MARRRARLVIRGLDELVTAIPRYGREVVRDVSAQAEAIATGAVEQMRQDAPFDPTKDEFPHLRDRIAAFVTFNTAGVRILLRAASRIAAPIEFGTARTAARPFFIRNVLTARNALRAATARAVLARAPRDLPIRLTGSAGIDRLPTVDLDAGNPRS
jgi:hypothetical protein